jgi:hypothetical protein
VNLRISKVFMFLHLFIISIPQLSKTNTIDCKMFLKVFQNKLTRNASLINAVRIRNISTDNIKSLSNTLKNVESITSSVKSKINEYKFDFKQFELNPEKITPLVREYTDMKVRVDCLNNSYSLLTAIIFVGIPTLGYLKYHSMEIEFKKAKTCSYCRKD